MGEVEESPLVVFSSRVEQILANAYVYQQQDGTVVFFSFDLIDPAVTVEDLTDEVIDQLRAVYNEWTIKVEPQPGSQISRFVLTHRGNEVIPPHI